MASKIRNLSELGLSIPVHICKYCTNEGTVCEDIQAAYGDGFGAYEGMPNICACDAFEPAMITRREGTNRINRLKLKSLNSL